MAQKRVSQEIERKIIELYNIGRGTCNIAKETGLNRCTVLLYLKKNNIFPKKITRPHKNLFNIKFFNEYNKISAYWAGFIAADGNIRSNKKCIQIGLSNKDRDHLKKFSNAIKFTGPLYYYKKTNEISIHVAGEWFIKDLFEKYEISPKKSLIINFPKNLPKELWPHFIRGYFDGDGSINSVDNCSSVVVSFVGCHLIIKKIRDALHEKLCLSIFDGIYHKAPLHDTKSKKVKQFAYSGRNAKKILRWMYNDTDESIRLERKYNRYLEWEDKADKRFGPMEEETKNKISVAISGDHGPNAKLSNLDAKMIKEMYNTGFYKYRILSEIFGVGYDAIRHIIIGKTFKYI